MDARIRDAQPGDVPFLARVLLLSSRSQVPRGPWDLFVAGKDTEVLAYLERILGAKSRSWCHHSCFRVAEVAGQPVSALSSFDAASLGMETLMAAIGEVAEALGQGEADLEAASGRLAPFLTCMSEQEPGTWIIENVATLPEHRRQGLSGKLLADMIERGRALGYRLSQISHLIGNDPANRLYLRHGYRAADEKRHPDFEAAIGCPGIVRLVREL